MEHSEKIEIPIDDTMVLKKGDPVIVADVHRPKHTYAYGQVKSVTEKAGIINVQVENEEERFTSDGFVYTSNDALRVGKRLLLVHPKLQDEIARQDLVRIMLLAKWDVVPVEMLEKIHTILLSVKGAV